MKRQTEVDSHVREFVFGMLYGMAAMWVFCAVTR